MNFLLRNIESSLDERFLLIGEKLLDKGQPVRLEESEHNLWVARVEQFEVEIQISPSRVKAYSCECRTFQQERMCGHIGASLLALRRRMSEKPKRPARKKRLPRIYNKLTVTAIMDNLRSEELADFVMGYAKKNPAFSLALKARFAVNVAMPDNSMKYALLLESAIGAGRKRDSTIGPGGCKQISQLAHELLRQVENALVQEHFAESFDILKSLVEKLAPLLNKCHDPDERLPEVLVETMEKWKLLAAGHLPPALHEIIWGYLLREIPRPVNLMHGFSEKMLDLSYGLANDKAKLIALFEYVKKELQKHNLHSEYRSALWRVQLKIVNQKGMKARARHFIKEVLANKAHALLVLKIANEESLWECVRHLSKQMLKLNPNAEIRHTLELALLDAALHENEIDTVLRLSKQLFLSTGKLEFLRLCRKHAGKEWATCLNSILAQLESSSFSEILASVYAEEKMTGELLALVSQKGTLRDLVRFDAHLIGDYPKEVTALYKQHLTVYLDSHFGEVPAREIRRLINRLKKNGGGKIAATLITFVKKKYPHRDSLREEVLLF